MEPSRNFKGLPKVDPKYWSKWVLQGDSYGILKILTEQSFWRPMVLCVKATVLQRTTANRKSSLHCARVF